MSSKKNSTADDSKEFHDAEENMDELASGSSTASQSKSPTESLSQRFGRKEWDAQPVWSWDVATDWCALCSNKIMELCSACQSEASCSRPKENCTVEWGKCNHAFHFHCISRWLSMQDVCPLDNKQWIKKL